MSVSVDRSAIGRLAGEAGGVRVWLWGWRDRDARQGIADLQARGVISVRKWIADTPQVD